MKAEIASRVDFSDARLPLNQQVVSYIEASRQDGAYVVLVTGSHQSLADSVAAGAGAGLFDEVHGSSADVNLTSVRKRDFLVERFGSKGFDYIGNDTDDLDVWPDADKALIVSSVDGLAKSANIEFDSIFEPDTTSWRDYLSLIRVHQWSKNALILVPFFLDRRFSDGSAAAAIFCAFFAMSLLASATYIVNDMLDLQSDRQNTTKNKRVLASGRISLRVGFQVMAGLLGIVFLLMLFLPLGFNLILFVYTVTTLFYTFALKERAIIDVIVLAALHTLRVIAGTVAITAAWSFWLLAFSMFVFLSLALAKRVAELINLQKQGRDATVGRDYSVSDIPVLQSMGITAGFMSVLVVALYINGDKVLRNYEHPMVLWLICPILLYWIGRLWLKTTRGHMHEDPIVFVMRDATSRVTVLLVAAVVAVAMFI